MWQSSARTSKIIQFLLGLGEGSLSLTKRWMRGHFQARHKGQVWRNKTKNKCWCQKVAKQAIRYI